MTRQLKITVFMKESALLKGINEIQILEGIFENT